MSANINLQNSATQNQLQHQCQYKSALTKAQRLISSKNRQITTLNRIIKNLNNQISDLKTTRMSKQEEFRTMRQQVEELKNIISISEIQRINEKEQLAQQFMQMVRKIQSKYERNRAKNKTSRVKTVVDYNKSPRLSFQFQGAHNLLESERSIPNYSKKQFNMGQLFMEKHMSLNYPKSKIGSWGRVEELNIPGGKNFAMEKGKQAYQYGFTKRQLNFQTLIENIRRQNEQLKLPLF